MNNDFEKTLQDTSEVGYVRKLLHSVCFVEGLPNAHLNELVMFENGAKGLVFSLTVEYCEILLLSSKAILVGERVARTGKYIQIGLGDYLFGATIDPLGEIIGKPKAIEIEAYRAIDQQPQGMIGRKSVNESLSTGVKMVDILVPLGKGQRELVIGDRKTGKTLFLLQTMLNQVRQGTICIYAAVGKQQQDINALHDFIDSQGIRESVIVVATGAAEPPGKVFLAPYTAMTIAEYYRDKGKDSLVIMDDLNAHAKYYREISLEAKRFPGRSSYPGDIFYTHARLMERAGNFEKAAITCLPVAESIMGDLSGYIQTNIMSMTDGHIYFDIERFNDGQRPAVDPFLSVTRVGLQAQSPLVRQVNRHLTSFLVSLEKMKDFMHFGAEMSDQVRDTLSRGEQLMVLFNQDYREVVPMNITVYLIGLLWADKYKGLSADATDQEFTKAIQEYQSNEDYRKKIDGIIMSTPDFNELISKLQ